MAFRRPKKPIRPRVVALNGDDSEDDGNKMDVDFVDSPPPTAKPKPTPTFLSNKAKNGHHGGKMSFGQDEDSEVVSFKPKGKQKPSKEVSLLSFDDVDEEGDDGEIFQVKKSSVSRRLMKQRERGKDPSSKGKSSRKERDIKPDLQALQRTYGPLKAQVENFASHIKIKEESVEDDDEPGIKVKVKIEDNLKAKNTVDFTPRVLNGREAEALHMEEEDDEEEEEEEEEVSGGGSSTGHKFRLRRPAGGGAGIQDAVRRALEQGQIPDANLIHEARKRKQMARDMGTGSGAEFVPVDNVDRFRNEKGRLVREDDDNDHESDEERVDFSSATNAAKIDREKRIEEFNAAQDQASSNDSDGELDEWESQQIRKGVSQAKMQNVAKELYNQGYMDSPSASFLSHHQQQDTVPTGGFAFYPTPEPKAIKKGKTQAFMEQTQKIASIEEVVNGSKKVTPELILRQMTERFERLKTSRDRNAGELSRIQADLQLADKELGEANEVKGTLNSRFIMYQNLRGYVSDLVDCLRCKVPDIDALEKRMIELMKARRDKFSERRRQDVRDQTEEVAATINIMGGVPVTKPPPTNPERTRRAAEREGRRTRRRRLREKETIAKMHKDGLSSDDEEPEVEFKAYCASRENLIAEVESVFEDVHEDFGTVSGILSRFEEWRENDFDSYKESYAYLCLPKCVAPIIRLHLITWDPLREGCDLMKQSWMKALLSYAYKQGESVDELATDPDSRLVPSVVEKVVLPWISNVIEARWDPTCCSQTRLLVIVLNRLIEDYSISPSSKPMHSLMETVIARFKDSLENDIYVPIYPKSAMANNFTPASVFLSRQFWLSVKLLDNMSKWQGVLGDRPLQALALDGLLTRYALLGIRVASDLSESVERAKGVVNVLPRAWLVREGDEIPNGLQQLSRCLVSLVQNSTELITAANRIAVPEIASVLKTIGFNEEAQIILRKYS